MAAPRSDAVPLVERPRVFAVVCIGVAAWPLIFPAAGDVRLLACQAITTAVLLMATAMKLTVGVRMAVRRRGIEEVTDGPAVVRLQHAARAAKIPAPSLWVRSSPQRPIALVGALPGGAWIVCDRPIIDHLTLPALVSLCVQIRCRAVMIRSLGSILCGAISGAGAGLAGTGHPWGIAIAILGVVALQAMYATTMLRVTTSLPQALAAAAPRRPAPAGPGAATAA